MRICTITCHDVYNVGASLQAYSLQKYLQNQGHKVKIIDYKPDYLSGHYKFTSIDNPKYEKNFIIKLLYIIAKFPFRIINIKRKYVFDKFKKDFINLTDKTYETYEELKQNPPQADLYIAGSDQIWNTLFKNGKDPAFYLDFGTEKIKKVSYAASFATEDIDKQYREFVKSKLKKLDAISVREISGLKIMSDLGLNGGVQVMDPVFLLSDSFWNDMCIDIKAQDYIFLYDFDNNPEILKITKKLAEIYNLKIYSVFKADGIDKYVKNVGPIEFISYIKNAKFVVSNSFHGTCYSIIFEVPFVVINRKEGINTRMRDLLLILGLENRLIDSVLDIKKLEDINYPLVKKNLEVLVEKSKQYISDIGRIKNE